MLCVKAKLTLVSFLFPCLFCTFPQATSVFCRLIFSFQKVWFRAFYCQHPPLLVFEKFHSWLDIWQGLRFLSANCLPLHQEFHWNRQIWVSCGRQHAKFSVDIHIYYIYFVHILERFKNTQLSQLYWMYVYITKHHCKGLPLAVFCLLFDLVCLNFELPCSA